MVEKMESLKDQETWDFLGEFIIGLLQWHFHTDFDKILYCFKRRNMNTYFKVRVLKARSQLLIILLDYT